jgi:CRISPR-associated protein Cmr3
MEFTRVEMDGEERMKCAHSLVLTLDTGASLKEGADFLGGERRVIRWQISRSSLSVWPVCPDKVRERIVDKKHCRLILATPAHFEGGSDPGHLLHGFGVEVSVQGAALGRCQTISGWDYERREPKKTSRLVPAGSVYFLKIEGNPGKEEIEAFIDAIWLKPTSDGQQWRNDGFGMALLGAWDGDYHEMEVNS